MNFVFPEDDRIKGIPQRTEWSRPPSSTQSRLGRRNIQRNESYQQQFLQKLRKAFEEADPDNLGYLDQSRWDSSGIRQIIHDGTLNRPEFSLFFKRIDATAEGKISWGKLVHYLLKETNGSDFKKSGEAIQFIRKWPTPPQNKNQSHREMVCQILASYKTNEYITISSDSVRFWNCSDLAYKRVINDTSLFCCGVVFNNTSTLALATTNRRLLFYDIETLNRLPIEVCASPTARMIKNMTQDQSKQTLRTLKSSDMPMFNVPSALCIAENSIVSEYDVPFFVGDDQGQIEVYNLSLPKRRSGTDFHINRITHVKLHRGKITQVDVINATTYATSSLDMRVVFFTYSPHSATIQQTQVFKDNEPICCFVYNLTQKCLTTCGISRDAYIWSHGSGKKISKLGGHYNQVVKIVNYTTTTKENYIVSMTNKKEFRLWDASSYRLMKEWTDPAVLRPENHYSALFFDPHRNQLISAASFPVKWAEDMSSKNDQFEKTTHSRTIVGVFSAPEFDQVVTVDTVCAIKAWNISTGTCEMSHIEPLDDKYSEISAATLDCKGRTLITTTFSNKVAQWNYNSGTRIADHNLVGAKSLVSVMKCFSAQGKDYLIRAGWDKTIWLYIELGQVWELLRSYTGHTHDISEAIGFNGGVVSGTVNGEILCWSFDTNVPVAACALKPATGVEVMRTIDNTLLIGDSTGNLHIMTLPRLEFVKTLHAHEITARHSLTTITIDHENEFLFTGDTLGYVKKWKIKKIGDTIGLEGVDIHRCHRDEITAIVLVKENKVLVTCGTDKCVRLYDASDFTYIGFFSDETKWNYEDKTTWVNEAPFLTDERHFKKGALIFGQSNNSVIGFGDLSSDDLHSKSSQSLKSMLGAVSSPEKPKKQSLSEYAAEFYKKEEEEKQKNLQKEKEKKVEPKITDPDYDYGKIIRIIDDYMDNPPNYIPQSLPNMIENENIRYQPLKPIPELMPHARPNELMMTIKSLLPDETPKVEKRKIKMPILVQPQNNFRRASTPKTSRKYRD